jgi:hypothetical protein
MVFRDKARGAGKQTLPSGECALAAGDRRR